MRLKNKPFKQKVQGAMVVTDKRLGLRIFQMIGGEEHEGKTIPGPIKENGPGVSNSAAIRLLS